MGRYKCNHCGQLCFSLKQIREHIDKHCTKAGKPEKHLGCPFCNLVFSLRNMRNAHMLSHTDDGSLTYIYLTYMFNRDRSCVMWKVCSITGLKCHFCKDDNVWEKWIELRKHYSQKHASQLRSVLSVPKEPSKKTPKPLPPVTNRRCTLVSL